MAVRTIGTSPLAFVAALVLSCFAFLTIWGALDILRLGWCSDGWAECSPLLAVPAHALTCALLAGLASLPIVFAFRARLNAASAAKRISLAIACGILLVLVYPAALAIRSTIGTRFFPYETAIRFGPTGFFVVWTVLCLLVTSIVVSGAGFWLVKVNQRI